MSFVINRSAPPSIAVETCMASIVLILEYFPRNLPARSAIPDDISNSLKFLPCLRKFENFKASFLLPLFIGLGRTSVNVITEENASNSPD